IDEIDKSDLDLPNDLLNILEEGEYEIPELVRAARHTPAAEVMIAGTDDRVPVLRGRVRCRAFPFVVLTSNGEREFPPVFLRRCVRLCGEAPPPAFRLSPSPLPFPLATRLAAVPLDPPVVPHFFRSVGGPAHVQ
ncbi:hypothetical protein AB9Q10_45360, partial [Streptomyces krungchingensis]